MEFTREVDLVDHILRIARRMGYTATPEPSSSGTFRRRGLGWPMGGSRLRPDILVERGDRSVLVETKLKPALMSAVMQIHEYRNYFGIPTILCIPDRAFRSTPQSVKDFAQRNNVGMCSLSQIEGALRECLG